jgi:hypothetical protein
VYAEDTVRNPLGNGVCEYLPRSLLAVSTAEFNTLLWLSASVRTEFRSEGVGIQVRALEGEA